MKIFGLLAIVMATTLWSGGGGPEAATERQWRSWSGARLPEQRQRAAARARADREKAKTRAKKEQAQKAADQTHQQQSRANEDTHPTGSTNLSSPGNDRSHNRYDHRVHVALAAAGVVAALVLAPKFTVAVVGAGVLAAVAYALVPPMLAAMRHEGEGSRFDVFTWELKAHLESTANDIKERAARARSLRQGASTAWSNTLSWLGSALGSLAGSTGHTASAASK